MSLSDGLTIYNYRLNIEELVNAFQQYDHMFFFCKHNVRTVIESAVQISLDELTEYDPLKANQNLMSFIIRDIELYQSRRPNPFLEDSNYIDNLEIIAGQIEEYVDYFVRLRIPMNHQCLIIRPKWLGNDLIFNLRIY